MRTVREEERPTLLLMAAGAVAGAAAGLFLGRRYRSMDAFLHDMRGRFSSLRDIWYDEALSHEDRVRFSADVADVDELDEEDEDFDELDEDELEGAPYENAEAFDGDDDLDDDVDDDDEETEASLDDYDDDFEDELAEVTRTNGAPESRRGEETDRLLEERVLQALTDEPILGARAIEIAVVGDGVVELTGTVHAIEEVARASAMARSVPGVTMVLNRIVVRAGGNLDTASVARDPLDAPEG